MKFGGLGEALGPSNVIEKYDILGDQWTVIDAKIDTSGLSGLGNNFKLANTACAIQINPN